jgi:regulator of microtubule dynamics protein 3
LRKIFLASFFLLSACVFTFAADVKTLIVQGDSLYAQFNNRGAEKKFIEALQYEPQNPEILWRLARTMVDIGEHMPNDQQEPYFNSALEYADKTIKAAPKHPQGYLRKAIAIGKIALFKGVFKSISLVKQVKENVDKTIALDPNEPVAHYVLARTHAKLCEKPRLARKLLGLDWADETICEKEFQKAIQLDPTYIMFRYDYALFLTEIKKDADAKFQLNKVLELPIRDEDDAAKKKEAKSLLQKK